MRTRATHELLSDWFQSFRRWRSPLRKLWYLSESDLDASLQWLRGSSGPVKGNPITALRSGLGTFLSRALGGGKQEYQLKSGRFVVP